MPATSAGVVMYRKSGPGLQVLLVHPGGPFWRKKDLGAWSIPKGEMAAGEDPVVVARREFMEETGTEPRGDVHPLGEVRQAGGKRVLAFAIEGDIDADNIISNTFELEWPPRSGRKQAFPEVDRAAWFDMASARSRILAGQLPLLERLEAYVDGNLTG